MATLHLINAAPHSSSALRQCLYAASDGDTVLLIENGVFCAVATISCPASLRFGHTLPINLGS